MFKKRKYNKKSSKKYKDYTNKKKSGDDFPEKTASHLLRYLYSVDGPVSLQELTEQIADDSVSRKQIKDTLANLCNQGFAAKDRKNSYELAPKAPIYEGTLSQHPRGFGFITFCHKKDGTSELERDPFVGQGKLAGAMHGDRVLIQVLRIRNDKRPEAVILAVTSHAADEIYGTYQQHPKGAVVYPDDPGFPFIINITPDKKLQPANGEIVKAKISRDSLSGKEISGKIVEIIGDPETVDTQLRLISGKFDLPSDFSQATMDETDGISDEIIPGENREDLRSLSHVTIDGETAKDFDDAVCVMKDRKGFTLHVSIADVSHYVLPQSPIDEDAYARGTSIYFPGRVIPMLPEKLSNNLCSLVPDQDRFTVTAILHYDREGNLLSSRFCRSIIKSRKRFTYNTVASILIDKDPDTRRDHKQHLTHLKWMQELATALITRKKARGAIDFDLAEAEFTLSDEGKVAEIKNSERTFAHRIIEEFMLAANEAVATLFSSKKLVGMFRVHEAPDNLKAEEFYKFAQTLGENLPPLKNKPLWYNEVIEKCRSTRYEYIINNLILRTMQQAHYSAGNLGHFGLALENYTHFTSPIRRYPDLIVHRVLLHYLDSEQPGDTNSYEQMDKKGVHLSSRERIAMNAEREIAERLKLHFMKHKQGEHFHGIISGVIDSCLFVEIPELCVSGSIDIIHLEDDYYIYDAKHHRLFGEISAKTYQVGDAIDVVLSDVDVPRRRINFIPSPVTEEGEHQFM